MEMSPQYPLNLGNPWNYLEVLEEIELSYLCWELNHDSSVVQPVKFDFRFLKWPSLMGPKSSSNYVAVLVDKRFKEIIICTQLPDISKNLSKIIWNMFIKY
jgi:hypothetical protein